MFTVPLLVGKAINCVSEGLSLVREGSGEKMVSWLTEPEGGTYPVTLEDLVVGVEVQTLESARRKGKVVRSITYSVIKDQFLWCMHVCTYIYM